MMTPSLRTLVAGGLRIAAGASDRPAFRRNPSGGASQANWGVWNRVGPWSSTSGATS